MRRICFLLSTLFLSSGACALLLGQEPAERPALETSAERVQNATATIRISCLKKGADEAAERSGGSKKKRGDGPSSDDKDCKRPCSVVVCTGVCVAANKIVTAVPVGSDSQIRLTFPGGKQDDARLRVVDEFSGLVLLDSPKCAARPLELGSELPVAGSTVMTAAAWGVEKPLVFQGMVSGQGHTLAGLCSPPLLVCQLPTTDTSSGAAVVDRQGKLLGIVVGADPARSQQSWMTYAVPVSHVQRLLRACEESDKEGRHETVIVLKRRRPVVGWMLESEETGEIVVKRITDGGPAAKAGIQMGDRVLAVEGIHIRSIYQAWSPTFCKQAGDTLTYRVQRGDRTLDVVVVLGGAVEVDSLPADKLSEIVQPKLEFGRDEKGTFYFKPFRTSSGDAERIDQLQAENEQLKEQLQRLEGKAPAAAEK
ncbi:MAG TPA: S1C family serine protease, partial [Pirellulaceae bacterium]|nr:S1C family serine protease [Pirellulaceae bacterium]